MFDSKEAIEKKKQEVILWEDYANSVGTKTFKKHLTKKLLDIVIRNINALLQNNEIDIMYQVCGEEICLVKDGDETFGKGLLSGGEGAFFNMLVKIDMLRKLQTHNFLVLDESFAMLDEDNIFRILGILTKQQIKMIVATHDQSLADICNSTLIVRHGHIEKHVKIGK